MSSHRLILLFLILELVQIVVVWLYIRHRYRLSLRQLIRLTARLADGSPPTSYYIGGTRRMDEVTRNLERVGALLGDLQRDQQKQDLNVLLANMVEGVMVIDARHVIRMVNDELMKLFDLRQSPLERTVLEGLREARVEMVVRETLESGLPRREEISLQSSAGAEATRNFEVSAVPIRNPAGEIDGAVVVFHDITRIKQLEVVRRDFVANVSHELRTPLAIFRGYLETLIEHPTLPKEDVRRVLDAMQRNSNRLNSLVEDLLVLTRLESRQIEADYATIHLDAFFEQLIRDWNERADTAEAELRWEGPPTLPPLDVDVLRFEQVILNLVENSVAYSTAPRRITLSARPEGAMMEIAVTDNGLGIPPADLPHVFERFYRVEKARSRLSGGTGLGLSICKEIVEAHGGSIRAESEFGKGTAIILRLPLMRASASASQFIPMPEEKSSIAGVV
jgi:two-component system phosphate regulon sensor histidine kinase PhoR